jgi:hypothetical protein
MIEPSTLGWSIVMFILMTGMLQIVFENADDE